MPTTNPAWRTGTRSETADWLSLSLEESSVAEELLFAATAARGLDVPISVLRRWLALAEIGGLRVIVVIRPFKPGAVVELFPPLKGGEIVEVGATVGLPGITDDDGTTGTEAPAVEDNDGPKCVTIEKDME